MFDKDHLFINLVTFLLFVFFVSMFFFSDFYFQKKLENLKKKNASLEAEIDKSYQEEKVDRVFNDYDILKVIILGFLILIFVIVLISVNIKINCLISENSTDNGG